MVQTVLRYNTPLVRANNGFRLRTDVSDTNRLEVCAAYTGTRDKTVIVVVVEDVSFINNRKEASVTVYDFYNRDEVASILYNM